MSTLTLFLNNKNFEVYYNSQKVKILDNFEISIENTPGVISLPSSDMFEILSPVQTEPSILHNLDWKYVVKINDSVSQEIGSLIFNRHNSGLDVLAFRPDNNIFKFKIKIETSKITLSYYSYYVYSEYRSYSAPSIYQDDIEIFRLNSGQFEMVDGDKKIYTKYFVSNSISDSSKYMLVPYDTMLDSEKFLSI